MKKTLLTLALLAAFGSAMAQQSADNNLQNGGAAAGANSAAGSVSDSNSRSTSVAGANGSADSQSGALAGSNSEINMTIEATQPLREQTIRNIQEGSTKIRNVPGVVVSGPASGPCTGLSGGAGASWVGAGFGFNVASVDKNCSLRENARIFAMILPTLPAEEQMEVRKMLMGTLTTIYNEHVLASEPKK